MSDKGMFGNLGNLMKQAQAMQERLAKVQAEVATKTVQASAGGGMVTVVANGAMEIVSVKIDPEVLKASDGEMLQDLVVAAANEALRKAREMVAEEMKGLYHVLAGALSPLDGVGPTDIKAQDLVDRLARGKVEEVIIATSPTIEGEATAIYLSRLIKPMGIRISRIACGVPVGVDLEYADEVTLLKSLDGRREI